MHTSLILSQTALIVILIINFKTNEVDAGRKVISVGNWFGSMEKVNRSPGENVEGTEHSPIPERSEPVTRKKKIKKRKKIVKKDWVPDEDSGEVTKLVKIKKKHKKKGGRRKLMKSVKELNGSESEEHEKRRKPVDIIVHIKMND